jgi:hypothetical protein
MTLYPELAPQTRLPAETDLTPDRQYEHCLPSWPRWPTSSHQRVEP